MTIKISIGKKTPSLQEQLDTNPHKGWENEKLIGESTLQTALDDKSNPMQISPINTTLIPQVTTEKYALLATASDTLSEKTIEQFEIRMQTVINSMNNSELPNAMERVSVYAKEHPELRPFIRAEDVQIFVRGARNSYAKVAEAKLKNRASKSKSSLLDANIADSLSDLVIDL